MWYIITPFIAAFVAYIVAKDDLYETNCGNKEFWAGTVFIVSAWINLLAFLFKLFFK